MKLATVPRRDWRPVSRRRVVSFRNRLRPVYGIPVTRPHFAPVDELILTVLSQSTNDRNRDVAFLRLRERFGSWEHIRDAPRDDVEAAIQPGGLHRQKSARIQEILRALPDDVGLGHLAQMPVAAARAELCALPGVGRKTAACVLLFSFGMHDIPVDTHVSRVVTRLGAFRPGAPFSELHDEMLRFTRPEEAFELHINLLRHGRRTCHAQRPRCGECVLQRACPRVGVVS